MEHAASVTHRRAVGICLGASTLSIVEIEDAPEGARVVNIVQKEHDGDPKAVLASHLDGYDLAGKCVGATGRKFRRVVAFPSITEPEATEYAFAHVNSGRKSYDAVVSAGAESFLVYQMDSKGKVTRISSGNKCASGTG